MEERFAVTAATGALGPVLVKLTALLGDESKLHHEGTRRDIVSVKSMLEPIHDLLAKLWGWEDLDVACKDWMTEAQELSYDPDDDIDRCFTLGLQSGNSGLIQLELQAFDDSPFKEFMERVNGVSKRCSEMQKIFDATICNHNKLTTDPRALFLRKDASELVAMEEKKEKLIRLLQEHEMVCIVGFAGMGKTTLVDLVYSTLGDQFHCRAFVSIHLNPNMMEILGTILRQVTNGAMSTGSGAEPASEENIIDDISTFLSDKRYCRGKVCLGLSLPQDPTHVGAARRWVCPFYRYLVIIDDIWHWEEWDVIRKALPKNNLGFKIILTTRIDALVDKCQTEQSAHVYTQSIRLSDAERLSTMTLQKSVEGDTIGEANAKWPSTEIAYMSGAMPLAVTCLSCAWAENCVQGYCWEWDNWESHALDRFLTIPSLKPLVKSLCVGFDDLPVQLRTCLLYCSIYPPEYEIERGCLVRKWIAEGFVSQDEVAEAYIDRLVSRSLLQPSGYHNICTVHPVLLAFLVCKAKEDNLVACREYSGLHGSSRNAKMIRRLSLYTDHYPNVEDVSHILSLHVLGGQALQHDVEKFENLRVLEIDSKGLENSDLVGICGLTRLRYLGLKGAAITELPRDIGRLENLETLHLRRTRIRKLPMEIEKLQRLETLNVIDTDVTELPKEIEKLHNLRTLNISGSMITKVAREIMEHCGLENLDVSYTKVRELHIPQNLRTLDITGSMIREASWAWRGIPNSLLLSVVVSHIDQPLVVKVPLPGVFSTSGDEEIICSSEAKGRGDLSIHMIFNRFGSVREVGLVRMLRVAGRHMKVPHWVKHDLRNVCSLEIRLWKLVKEDLEFLQWMPNLQALSLRFEVLPQEPVPITRVGFSKLETFYVDCRLPRVITFEERAMPNLQHLEFKLYTGTASQHYSMGIDNLLSLKQVVFRCFEFYTCDVPGISAAIDIVRKEAAKHRNQITLWVDDKDPEVFGKDARWISLADKAIVENEFKEWDKKIKRRERIVAERAESIREQRLRLFTAAEERRAQRDKSNARSAIEKEIQEKKSTFEKREQRLREQERYYNI